MEGEAFLLGVWKNFEEMEDCMSLPDLIAAVEAIRKREEREQKFHAAIQGIDIGDTSEEAGGTSFEDVWKEASGIKDEPEESRLARRGISYETDG